MYDSNGDMVTKEGQIFRQIGWQINGGEHDKLFLGFAHLEEFKADGIAHGGFSPVYVEVGKD